MKYDRKKAWDKTKVIQEEESFRTGYTLIVNAWDYSHYDPANYTANTPFNKGVLAGIKKRKEMEMITLLEGKRKSRVFTDATIPGTHFRQYKYIRPDLVTTVTVDFAADAEI